MPHKRKSQSSQRYCQTNTMRNQTRSTKPCRADRRTEPLSQTGHSQTLLAKVRCIGNRPLSVPFIMWRGLELAMCGAGTVCAADILTVRTVMAAYTIRNIQFEDRRWRFGEGSQEPGTWSLRAAKK